MNKIYTYNEDLIFTGVLDLPNGNEKPLNSTVIVPTTEYNKDKEVLVFKDNKWVAQKLIPFYIVNIEGKLVGSRMGVSKKSNEVTIVPPSDVRSELLTFNKDTNSWEVEKQDQRHIEIKQEEVVTYYIYDEETKFYVTLLQTTNKDKPPNSTTKKPPSKTHYLDKLKFEDGQWILEKYQEEIPDYILEAETNPN